MITLSMFASALWMAVRQIRRNVFRSFLTILGIVIGVAAVIALVTLGEGATRRVTEQVSSMGTNMLTLVPGSIRRGSTNVSASPLEMSDRAAIEKEIPAVSDVAPSSSAATLAIYGSTNWNTELSGTTSSYLTIRDLEVEEGRAFSETEEQAGSSVCLLGATVRRELFGGIRARGQIIRLGRVSCVVIGTLASKGQSTFGMDQDDFILMPLRAFQRRISGSNDVGSISLSATSESTVEKAKTQVEALMRQRRHILPGQQDNFEVRDVKEMAATLENVTTALTALLSAVAAVSLVVGGIGIMNIMVVSVTERTREIGTRLAIGARGREVLLQFLVEAVVLATLGGLVGIALGLSGSYFASRLLGLPFVFLPGIVGVAFGFSAFVGVVFGYLPAHQASRLNPIEALRHE